jgi:hypothetical protein
LFSYYFRLAIEGSDSGSGLMDPDPGGQKHKDPTDPDPPDPDPPDPDPQQWCTPNAERLKSSAQFD